MVTGFPEVRLTPYMGAVVLNVDLQSRAGVDGDSQVVLSSEASFFESSFPLPSTLVELPTVELVDEVSWVCLLDLTSKCWLILFDFVRL